MTIAELQKAYNKISKEHLFGEDRIKALCEFDKEHGTEFIKNLIKPLNKINGLLAQKNLLMSCKDFLPPRQYYDELNRLHTLNNEVALEIGWAIKKMGDDYVPSEYTLKPKVNHFDGQLELNEAQEKFQERMLSLANQHQMEEYVGVYQ